MGADIRVVVTGATGNIGTSVVTSLSRDPAVGSVVGVARREPTWSHPKVEFVSADLADVPEERLDRLISGADVVIHLAWLFQPTHDPATTWRANVVGSVRLFEAVARRGVPRLVYSSSVGAYSPGPKGTTVPESWPTHGWSDAAYTREKAYLERYLDFFECAQPGIGLVRIRPAFAFQYPSASQQRRLFAGPFVPSPLVRSRLIRAVPDVPGLRVQAVHSADLGEAFRLAAVKSVRGTFNVAADPVVDAQVLARILDARVFPVPARLARSALSAAWHAHLVPASPGLFDAVLRLPLMDTSRARNELEWAPERSAFEAVAEFLYGLRDGAGAATPPLAPSTMRGRVTELAKGVGNRP